ncbi:GGDEF domain-containing protein [Psychromonas aquimarina]|uniref:GGDEF domain-containing protein n=1 Tax=Psychromonas aquimarina TaxID=444919 RepID=UPI00041C4245|nr:GGDEF domain-containing protein [Psychromonas aquimarina]
MINWASTHLKLLTYKDPVEYREGITANFVIFLSLIGLALFTAGHFYYGNTALFYGCGLLLGLFSISLIIFKKQKSLLIILLTLLMGSGLLLIIYINKGQHYSATWSFLYIYICMIIYGHKNGLIFTGIYLFIVLAMLFTWVGQTIEVLEFIRFTFIALTSVFFSYLSEWSISATLKKLTDTQKNLEIISQTDGLTGLYNRRQFDSVFAKEINTAKRNKNILAFVMLDIDYFKYYNDAYGHQKGDSALIKVAQQLEAEMQRSNDAVFRIGGEEFALLFQVKEELDAVTKTEEIRKTIELLQIPHKDSRISAYLTLSAGVFTIKPQQIISEQYAYKACDELLYQAKKCGRNQVIHCI